MGNEETVWNEDSKIAKRGLHGIAKSLLPDLRQVQRVVRFISDLSASRLPRMSFLE